MGIHPYRTGSEITQGVLITFSDESTAQVSDEGRRGGLSRGRDRPSRPKTSARRRSGEEIAEE